MDDLISRQDALKALDEMSYKSPHESATSVVRKKHFGEILEKFIMQQPSAQKKGHWVKNHDSDHAWKCSECGCGYTDSKLSFCYDCGADMRGDANEDT